MTASHYRAFISYSQQDKSWAKRLHQWLEAYRIPKGIAADGVRRLGRFFLDDQEMSATSDIGAKVREGIENSDALIVLCSPRSARSKWVEAEVQHFRRTGRSNRIFALIIDGVPNSGDSESECFPPSFRHETLLDPGVMPVSPLGLDIREEGRERALARLVAGLLNANFDALWQRERRKQRTRVVLTGVLTMTGVLLLVAAFIATWVAIQKQEALLNMTAEAKSQRRAAQLQAAEAIAQRAEAQRQAAEALTQKAETERQTVEALTQKAETQRQTVEALTQREEAQRQATEAQRQKRDAQQQTALTLIEKSNRIARESAVLWEAEDFNTALLMALYADPEAARTPSEFAPKDGHPLARARLEAAFESMRYVRVLRNKAAISAVAFSPDGKLLVTADGEMESGGAATIRFWDTNTFEEVNSIPGPKGGTSALAFSPDGNQLAYGAYFASSDESVNIYNLKSQKRFELGKDPMMPAAHSMVFSSDGSLLAYSHSAQFISILDSSRRIELTKNNPIFIQGCEATSIAFTPSSGNFIAACEDRTIKIWPSISHSQIFKIGSFDRSLGIAVSNIRGVSLVSDLEQAANDISVSENGKRIAAAVGRLVIVWDLDSREEIARFAAQDLVSRVLFYPNGYLVASATGNVVDVWDLRTTSRVARLNGHEKGATISSIRFSSNGKFLASAATDRTVRIWEPYGGRMNYRFSGPAYPKSSVSFSNDGKFLSAKNSFSGSEVWDIDSTSPSFGKMIKDVTKLNFLSRKEEKVAISNDGTARASVSEGANIELSSGSGKDESRFLLTGHKSEVRSIAFSPNGRFLISASGDQENSIFLWDSRSGQQIAKFSGHVNNVNSVDFSPDGSRIASASSDLTLGVWEVPKIFLQSTAKQIKMACEKLRDVRAPLAFSVSDISKFPFLQGMPVDPANPNVLLSPCKGVLPPEAFAAR